jgi:O-antigen/teichoic acid export membrane protein
MAQNCYRQPPFVTSNDAQNFSIEPSVSNRDRTEPRSSHAVIGIESSINMPQRPERKPFAKVLLALSDQAFVSLNSFVTMMIVAKFCPVNELNVYVLAWSILCFCRVIQERLLAAPYVVFAHQADRENAAFLGSSLTHQFLFSGLNVLLFFALAALFQMKASPEGLGECFAVIALAIAPILLRDHLRAVSCTHFRYGAAALVSGVALILQLAIMFAIHRYGTLTAAGVFAAMGVASFLPSAIWLVLKTEPFTFVPGQVRTDWQTCFVYSRWLVAARFFPSIVNSLLPWMVLWMVSENASGVWGSCMTLANVSMMFVIGCNNLFQPQAVVALQKHGAAAMQRVLEFSAVIFAVALSAVCLVYFFAGEYLLGLAFNQALSQYGLVVTVLSIHVLICSLSMVAGNGLAALEKARGIFAGEFCWSIVTVIAAILLTPEFGLMGTATAICLGSLIAALVEGGWLIFWLKNGRTRLQESIA